jgi:PAS domain S-box-containing protein
MNLNYQSLFDSLPDAYLVLRADLPDYPVAAVSKQFLGSTKKTRSDVIDLPLKKVIPRCECLYGLLQEAHTKKVPNSLRAEFLFEKENEVWDVMHFPVIEDDGTVTHIIQRLQNVPNETGAQNSAHTILNKIAESLPVGITYINSQERYTYCNSTYAAWRGLSKNDIIGKSIQDFLDEENYVLAKRVIKGSLSGESHSSEININVDGVNRIIRTINIPDNGYDGHVQGFTMLSVDITDERQLEQSLREAKEAAEGANRAKSEFLANMSHEIRTPLGAVLGFADLIANTEVTPEEKKSFIAAIQRNGELLTNIISDILDLSKVEVGKLNVERKETSLREVLNDVMAILGKPAHEKQVALVLSFDSSVPWWITTDQFRLRQILLNVIGNAIKFTERGTVKLDINFSKDKNGKQLLNFNVADSGRGISEEQAKRLFKPFSQGDSSIVRRFGGTGLGLVLSRHLANLLGGDLVLTESVPGRGSVFTVTIDPSPYESDEPKMDIITEAKVISDFTSVRLDGKRILLVDDSVDNLFFISKVLKIAGAEVDIVDNGKDALERAQSGKYDACLMDIQMPEMDGYEAAAEMKKMQCQFPIIALTAHALKEVRRQCIENGFTDYISKPINRNELIEHISHVIRK